MNEQKNTTKTQIKQAAIRQIKKFGIDKTSMRSIAAEANMTTGAIYYYYKNKQDLFDEIVTDSIQTPSGRKAILTSIIRCNEM